MSSDTMPNLFPDRPIRPLPKRRLRERLSPQVAQSIQYPPSTLNSVPLFHYPCSSKEEETHPNIESTSSSGLLQQVESAKNLQNRRNGGVNGTDGAEAGRSALVTRSSPEILNRAVLSSSRPDQTRSARMQPAPSTPSSVDGYDSFENTNNKKKRKIPSASDSTLNSTHGLNIDMSSHPTSTYASSPSGEVNGDRSLYNPAGYAATGSFGSNGQGISGSGRGRLGRSRNGRSPLRALSDGNNLSAVRGSKGAPQWSSEHEGSGIISNAIANAEKLPPQGQENVSLLQQHSARGKGTPSSSQFTFTCDSQVTGTLHWPANSSRHNMNSHTGNGMLNGAQLTVNEDVAKTANRPSQRKTRRQVEKELVRAAEDRRRLAAKRYYQSPPKPEDFWICEFCEYEAIFGEPPRALIREYELKDRRFRQEEADRKRLLEKAKQKGRKGKKNGKPASKGSSTTTQPDSAATYDTNVPHRNQPGNDQSTQSEDDEDEQTAEYEEAYGSPPTSSKPGIEDDRGGGVGRVRGISVGSGGRSGGGTTRATRTELAVP